MAAAAKPREPNTSVEAMARSVGRHLVEVGHPLAEQFAAWLAARPLSSAERRRNRDAVLCRLAVERHSGLSGHQATAEIKRGLGRYAAGPWQHDRVYGLDPKYIGTEREAYFALMSLNVALSARTIRRAVTGLGHKNQ